MTISSTTVKNSYSGDGSTTAFNYTFKIFADSDLQVIIRSAAGTETVKTITTHYTVSGAGDANGGSVTFTSGNIPTATETVLLRRAVPQTQAIDYIANDPFPAESHEEGLDRATMTTQQIQEELDRAIKISRTNTMTSTEFTVDATNRANKILAFDSSGEISVTQELGTFVGNWSASTDYNARDIVKDTSTNNIFICTTSHTSSGSQPLTTNTDSAKWSLLVDAASASSSATAAASSATAAASSATAAASSATSASTQASNASTSASTASTQATNAANSATAAATSAAEAAASADNFDDTYLGAKSSDPSVDNDGDALNSGDLYFNTTSNTLKVYNGSSWQDAALTSSDFVSVSEFKNGGTNFTDSLLVGHSTTGTLSSADKNVGVGARALDAVTSGVRNVAIGVDALTALTTGVDNVAIGLSSQKSVVGTNNNTSVGYETLEFTTGGQNSAIGKQAGRLIDSGNWNIVFGHGAGTNITSGSGNVIIGNVNADSATGSRQLKIAGYDGSTTTNWISGDSSGNITVSGTVTANGQLLTAGGATWESKSSNFTAAASKNYFVDTSSNTVTATLPSSASAGDEIRFLDVSGTFDTNKLTVARNSHNIQGVADDLESTTNRAGFSLVYYNATQGWLITEKG